MPTAPLGRKPDREIKRERIELRVGASAKALIRRAMAVLRERGLIVSVQGRGTYVKARPK